MTPPPGEVEPCVDRRFIVWRHWRDGKVGIGKRPGDPSACGYDVGDPPDSCRCALPRGHGGMHECRHDHQNRGRDV